jgi:hypothetical protein
MSALSNALLKRIARYSGRKYDLPIHRWHLRALGIALPKSFEKLNARYQYHEQRWPFLGYEFKQFKVDATSVINQNNTHYSSVLVNPQMLLRLLVSHQHSLLKIQPVLREIRGRFSSIENVVIKTLPLNIRVEKTDLVTRILHQGIRHETAPVLTSNNKVSPSSQNNTYNPPNQRISKPKVASKIYRKTSTVSESVTQQSPQSKHTEKGLNFNNTQSSISDNQPIVDINRITDQVMQALDNRIVAQRERLGRM